MGLLLLFAYSYHFCDRDNKNNFMHQNHSFPGKKKKKNVLENGQKSNIVHPSRTLPCLSKRSQLRVIKSELYGSPFLPHKKT